MRDTGDLAIVLHSHMPYVEGFGTYPFGEEWLFEAVARSYIPVLDVARRVTVTVSPVLADQLEAPGVADRMRAFLREYRISAAERDAASDPPELREAAEAEERRYRTALEALERVDGSTLDAFRAAQREGRVELIPSVATHAVLPLVATHAGRRLQVDAGLRSHRRRFGPSEGFWLPECAYVPGLDRLLAERRVGFFCADQSGHEEPLAALAPVRTPAGPVAFTLDWTTISLVWSARGYPADPAYLEYHRHSPNGIRLWAVGGGPYDPAAAAGRAASHAADFVRAVAERLDAFRHEWGRRGLVTFAVDTELLGHWWAEGPLWLERVIEAAPAAGIELVTLTEAAGRHEPESRPLRAATWGERKDLSTWDAPRVADLAWGARRLELRVLRELATRRLTRAAALRAARELLAVQSSDWAFMDSRRQAGDYPFWRATGHAQSLLDAIDSSAVPDPRMRSLAPDLSLTPLLEP
jgi:1,4-alpha-glucan branching enzyme